MRGASEESMAETTLLSAGKALGAMICQLAAPERTRVTGGAPRCFTVMEVMAAGSSLRIAGLAGVAVEAVSGVLRCSDQ